MQLIRKSLMVKGGKKWYYDKGTFKTISDIYAYKSSGSSARVDKYAAEFIFKLDNAQGWFYSNVPIDLTYVRTLTFRAHNLNSLAVYVGVQPNTSNRTGLVSVNVPTNTYAEYTLDVSALTGNYYLTGGYVVGDTTRHVYVEQMWGE